MITEEIVLDRDSVDLIQELNKDFPTWTIKNMGSGRHYHFISKDRKEKGVLEITFPEDLGDRVVLKIADNRKSSWSLKALTQLKSYLKSYK